MHVEPLPDGTQHQDHQLAPEMLPEFFKTIEDFQPAGPVASIKNLVPHRQTQALQERDDAQGIPLRQPVSLGGAGGLASCELQVDAFESVFALVADRSDRFGRARVSLPIPINSGAAGAQITAQWAVLDPGLSLRLPLTTSNTMSVRIGEPPKTTSARFGRSMWAYGVEQQGTQGLRLSQLNYVPVTQFSGTFAP